MGHPAKPPTPAQLREAVLDDVRRAWQTFRAQRPDQTPYALILFGVEDGVSLSPQVLTEQGLEQAVQRYLQRGYCDSADEARHRLRYSIGDSPWADDLYNAMPTVDGLVEPFLDELRETNGYARLTKAATKALQELDAEGLFGRGAAREQILLAVIEHDSSSKEWVKSAKQLNPPTVVDRFTQQVGPPGPFQMCDRALFVDGGRHVVLAGSKANPDSGKGKPWESFTFMALYQLTRQGLSRCWDVRTQGLTQPICGEGRADFFATAPRSKVPGEPDVAIRRYGMGSASPIHEYTDTQQLADVAISRDGSRLVGSTSSGTLSVFDESFNRLNHFETDGSRFRLCCLSADRVLVGGNDDSVHLYDLSSGKLIREVSLPGFHMRTDASGRLLATSRWFSAGSSADRDRPFGCWLCSLPDFTPIHHLEIPDHQLVRPELSPDGRWVAVRASPIRGNRNRVALFDVVQGTWRGWRKSESHADPMCFSPDSLLLAVPKTGYLAGPPVELWTIDDASIASQWTPIGQIPPPTTSDGE